MSAVVIIIIITVIVVFLVYASYSIEANIYVKAFCRCHTTEKIIALTFDDGPSPNTPAVLDTLKRNNAKATFFLIGDNIAGNEATVKRIKDEGHSIGNHSMHHRGTFPLQSSLSIAQEIADCDKAIENVTGEKPLFFRPPFGVTNPLVANGIKKTQHNVIGWSIRSFDTMSTPVEKTLDRIKKQLAPGKIILLHDRMPGAPQLTSMVIEEIKKKGYTIVTAGQLMAQEYHKKNKTDI